MALPSSGLSRLKPPKKIPDYSLSLEQRFKLGILKYVLKDAFIFKNDSNKYIYLTKSDCEFLDIEYEHNLIVSHKRRDQLTK